MLNIFRRNKEPLVYKYNRRKMPLDFVKFYIEYVNYGRDAAFKMEESEIAVKEGDYLVIEDNRLYYYPKDIYETRVNKEIVGRKEEK